VINKEPSRLLEVVCGRFRTRSPDYRIGWTGMMDEKQEKI